MVGAMKYMGSKRAMLQNGLGDLLSRHVPRCRRFVDLFAGSASVAIHVAVRVKVPVVAYDLQNYSAVLAGAVLNRVSALRWKPSLSAWIRRAGEQTKEVRIPKVSKLTRETITQMRQWCCGQANHTITRAYGGHYFSPLQSIWMDSLRQCLPRDEPARTVALAALIRAASKCAAAPGHTAQPFQPTRRAKRFILDAWSKDVVEKTSAAYEELATQFARQHGHAAVSDANAAATRLRETDCVFVDPPYSGVHYSRFYHVLETIANGSCGEVSGTGRYPAREFRPQSRYSCAGDSEDALDDLLARISSRGSRVILTFPDHECSNGLSGATVRDIAADYFRVEEQQITSRFSTLGGNGVTNGDSRGRAARKSAEELVLVLRPR